MTTPNKRPGKCFACARLVGTGRGFAVTLQGRPYTACTLHLPVEPESVAVAEPAPAVVHKMSGSYVETPAPETPADESPADECDGAPDVAPDEG